MPLMTPKQSRRRCTSRTWHGRLVGTASNCSCAHMMVVICQAINASGTTPFVEGLPRACCR